MLTYSLNDSDWEDDPRTFKKVSELSELKNLVEIGNSFHVKIDQLELLEEIIKK